MVGRQARGGRSPMESGCWGAGKRRAEPDGKWWLETGDEARAGPGVEEGGRNSASRMMQARGGEARQKRARLRPPEGDTRPAGRNN